MPYLQLIGSRHMVTCMYSSNANNNLSMYCLTNRHNKAVWQIRKLLVSNKVTRHYIFMNACTYHELPQENTIPIWLLPCTCSTQRCHCNAMLKPDILCILGHPYNSPPPTRSTHTKNHYTIHSIHIL